MKIVYTGLESSGKSLQLSRKAKQVLFRNKKWLRITGVPRTMAFNQPMSKYFVDEVKSSGINYIEFRDFSEVEFLDNADIFIDELIKFFPATGSSPLAREQLDFLTQGAKSGIHIYAATQDFSQVHKQFRLLTNEVYVVTKLIGSRRPMKTAPPVKMIWGVCITRQVDPRSFKGDNATMESKGFPWPFLIEKADTERFDTTYKILPSELPTKVVRRQRIVGRNKDGEVVYEKETWV